MPRVTVFTQERRVTYHITVRRASGLLEDPSRELGTP
jgi:hypothetical protein